MKRSICWWEIRWRRNRDEKKGDGKKGRWDEKNLRNLLNLRAYFFSANFVNSA